MLLLPLSVQLFHELQNHEHNICTSSSEHHIHKEYIDCAEFYKQLSIFSINFASNYDVIFTHFYTTLFIDNPQIFKEVCHSKKSSRGPPYFTI